MRELPRWLNAFIVDGVPGLRRGPLRVGGGALGVLAVWVGDLCDRVRRDLMR